MGSCARRTLDLETELAWGFLDYLLLGTSAPGRAQAACEGAHAMRIRMRCAGASAMYEADGQACVGAHGRTLTKACKRH